MSPLNAVNDRNPRQIAAQILSQRRANGEFTETLLDRALANAKLSAPDRGLCQEIVYGCVRWQAALDFLISKKTNGREQKSALQNLLRLGLYQIFWLNKIPAHAAVHETVELAKRNGFGPQSGFINAVLRGYLREFDGTKKILADLKISNPAIGFSHPQWLVEKWQNRFGEEKMRRLLEWNNSPPKIFARVNTLKFGGASVLASQSESKRLVGTLAPPKDAGALLEKWREENVEYDFVRRDFLGRDDLPVGQDAQQRVPTENLIFELKSHPPLASLESFRDGWFYVQDPSTLLAPKFLEPKPGETILDLCAAPGGKTAFIAQLMNNEGKIVASDISEKRLKLVRENCQRLGVTCVEEFTIDDLRLTSQSPERERKSYIENRKSNPQSAIGNLRFNKILIDAPCSNSGVMRRRVDLRWRISPEEILRLRQTQLDLLKLAATKLKSGGILIYSTCSLEPEENSEVVKEFLREHKNFKLEAERELLPFSDEVDGAFVAKLKII